LLFRSAPRRVAVAPTRAARCHSERSVPSRAASGNREGRTRAWYWRQVTAAIVAGFFEQIASHKLLALRALIVGWLTWYFLRDATLMAFRATVNPWSIRLPVLASLVWWTAFFFKLCLGLPFAVNPLSST
jgi:hypothetical protein